MLWNTKYQSIRKKLNFNTDWLFHKGEIKDALSTECNDSKWESVILPHTVQLEPKEWIDAPSYQGISYYRRYFTLPIGYRNKKIFIKFHGAMINSEVWLNGRKISINYGGYLPFTVDITNDVNLGKKNVLILKLNSNDDWETPPGKPQKELDFVYFPGLYRNVDLIITEKIYISDAIHANKVADGGVFITYPEVSKDKATIRVQSNVENEYEHTKNIKIKTILLNGDQSIIVEEETDTCALYPKSNFTFKQDLKIKKPKLWSMDEPNLYTVIIYVMDGNRIVDNYKRNIGVRNIKFTPDKGFFINNNKVLLNGVNFHEDYLYVGNAVADSMLYRDVKKIKDAGFNLIRTGHYPHNKAFMDACDQLGIATIVPTPGWQYYTDKGAFSSRSIQMTRNMIRLFRNHPSVILWEPILNETWYPESFAKEAYKAVHEEYPTCQTYAASDFGSPYGSEFDVVYKEAYSETKPLITREWGDANHNVFDGERSARKYGEISLISSSTHRQNSLKGDRWKNNEGEDGYWDWAGLNANKRISGYALWSYNDYNRGMSREIAHTGIVDRDRYPKFNYYWFKSQCPPQKKQMVFLANYWTEASPKDLHVYTNTEEVKLYINNKYIETRKPDVVEHISHPIIVFPNITWEPGEVKVEGLINGAVVATDTVITPGEPYQLKIEFDTCGRDELVANGSDMIMAFISIRDKKGNIVPTVDQEISLHLSGPGILIGNDDERVKANPVKSEAGIAPAFIRTTLNAGEIVLTASSKGLVLGSAVIKSVPSLEQFVPRESEVKRNSSNYVNLALGKEIKVSSECINNTGKSLIDKNKESFWLPQKTDTAPWAIIDLGNSYSITGVKLVWTPTERARKFNIAVSNNQEYWITIVDSFCTKEIEEYIFFASHARYVRVEPINQLNEGIMNIEIYGAKQILKNIKYKNNNINVALNKPVLASSYSHGNEPSMVTDHRNNQMWQADGYNLPQWILIDLEDVFPIVGLKILWGKDSTHYAYEVQVSKDGLSWLDAVDQTTTGSYYHPIDFDNTHFIRYVKVLIYNLMAGGGAERVAIKNIEIYRNRD
ncbi:DUF4982 domain-containing protein [Ornithinibacillus gellani]|uniref:discoidin domain-containing protein n=1 Tax=Ornithinibacillus gellani TaxID=2293253 RepID=UPI000F46C919|nr:discoidin domain-containing protein [Ornithinibacillus gellani]TQS71978.1 DUF4982 domain-containing protein [Ornithinibacillus gellani]